MRYLTAWLALVVSLSLPAERAPRERAQVEVFTPQGTVKGVRQVAVRFSEQTVTFGDPRIPEPFAIDCPESGKGRWADARNWVYDFGRDLPAGVKCTFKLKTSVTTLTGKSLGGAQEFSFSTGGPAILSSLPNEGDTGTQPVPGAAVRIGDYCTGQPIWQGSTDQDGIAMIEGGALPKPHAETDCGPWSPAPLFVSARTAEDMSFTVSGWNRGIRPYEFELPVGWEEGSFVAHAILDRGLYRAGEAVSMKHYLRQRTSGGFVIPTADPPDKLKLRHEGSGQEYEIPVAFDTLGIAESVWEIPKDAKIGVYQMSLHRKESDKWLNSSAFRVEQFRVPTLRAVIQAPAEPLVNAKEARVDLFVGYLSGGGASQAPVKLRSQVVAKSLNFPDYSEFAFGGADVKEGIEDNQRDYDYYFGPGSGGAGAKAPVQVLPLTLDNAGAARATIPNLPAMLDPDLTPESNRRSIAQKLMQVRAALRLEERWTKEQILEAYLNLTSFYGELQGIGAAARELFGKRPSGLSAAESAVLAALLPSPNRRGARLGKRACAIAGVDDTTPRCLDLMRLAEGLSDSQRHSRLPVTLASHLAHAGLRAPGERVQTTLERRLQRLALGALEQQLAGLRPNNVRDGAALIVDNHSGEVRAYVGAAGPHSNAIHVDGVRAPRQAGSTLKPFLYGLAIEQRYLTAASLLDYSPINLGTASGLYIPQNFDRDFKGLVSVRTALAGSLNVPAVRALVVTGVDAFRDRLEALGYRGITRDDDYYGYSLALGSAEISLYEQVNAYRTLANGGIVSPLKIWQDPAATDPPTRVMSEEAAYIVADILSDRAGRAVTFGLDNPLVTRFWSAVKTGTSKDMRDNWCIGFSSEYTVGVWVGNFEGDAMHRVSGVTGAAPVWLTIMSALHAGSPGTEPKRPSNLIMRTLSFVPSVEPRRQEWFVPGTETKLVRLADPGSRRPSILSPPDGVTIALDPDIPADKQRVLFSTSGLSDAILVLDGKTFRSRGNTYLWRPSPGKHTLALQIRYGRLYDQAHFTVRGLKPNYAHRNPY